MEFKMAKLVKKENPDGTSTVKVAKGSTVKTSTGKTATGGKIVGKLPKAKERMQVDLNDFNDDEEILSWDDDDVDFSDDSNYDELLEEESTDAVTDYIYVTKDGIVGNVNYDKLQIIDTTGIDEDGLTDLSYASFSEREDLANELRSSRSFVDSKHYFNDTGEYGDVRGLKVLKTSDLTKSELNKIYASDNPFAEADNYENSGYNVLTAASYYSHDSLLQGELNGKGLSY
jgi:hypothetical protein